MPQARRAKTAIPATAANDDAELPFARQAVLKRAGRRNMKTSEVVALQIVRDIVARQLKPGDKLPLEAELLKNYRVSRSSLREALRLLEVQDLISIRPGPGGGTVVGKVHP
ncbi:MAG: FadR/GntR family transcriptional regulator, partial [Gammaproteobacteria bacterium]